MSDAPQRGFDAAITFLRVRDLAATHAFYAATLGLELALDQGTCRIYRVTAGGFVGFCEATESQHPAAERWPDGVIVTLVRDDVEAYVDGLSSRGVAIEKPPTYNETYRIVQAFIRDPDGYLVEIQRFEDPRWDPS